MELPNFNRANTNKVPLLISIPQGDMIIRNDSDNQKNRLVPTISDSLSLEVNPNQVDLSNVSGAYKAPTLITLPGTPERSKTKATCGDKMEKLPPKTTIATNMGINTTTLEVKNTSTSVSAPLEPIVDKFPMTDEHLPCAVVDRIMFRSLKQKIKDFQSTSLLEIIRKNTTTRFPTTGTKYCYRLEYKSLSMTNITARDNYSDSMVERYSDSYTKQHMNSISGEKSDLCFYTYSPSQLRKFLDNNSGNKYTYIPVTVYAVDSANGNRHDMLLIFHNTSKLFYWFDCCNREDYLQISTDLPKNAIDILFMMFGNAANLGFAYEPSPSWMVQGTLHSYGSVGDFDFLLSTAWCYNVMLSLEYYESPTAYMSVLDSLTESDRFHLVYVSMLELISAEYRKYVPFASQVNLSADWVNPVKYIQSGVTPKPTELRTRTVPEQKSRTTDQSNGTQLTHKTTHGDANVSSRTNGKPSRETLTKYHSNKSKNKKDNGCSVQ